MRCRRNTNMQHRNAVRVLICVWQVLQAWWLVASPVACSALMSAYCASCLHIANEALLHRRRQVARWCWQGGKQWQITEKSMQQQQLPSPPCHCCHLAVKTLSQHKMLTLFSKGAGCGRHTERKRQAEAGSWKST